MPKRKSTDHIKVSSKKISFEKITGINANLGIMETARKGPQTDITKDNFYAYETPQYFFLLDKIADDRELNEDISQNYEGDQIDSFIETVKEIAEKLFNETKESIGNTSVENQNTKQSLLRR